MTLLLLLLLLLELSRITIFLTVINHYCRFILCGSVSPRDNGHIPQIPFHIYIFWGGQVFSQRTKGQQSAHPPTHVHITHHIVSVVNSLDNNTSIMAHTNSRFFIIIMFPHYVPKMSPLLGSIDTSQKCCSD